MPEGLFNDRPLAIVAEEDLVLGFAALGFQVYPIRQEQEFPATLEQVLTGKAMVCLIEDKLYRAEGSLLNKYKSLPYPIFIPFTKDSEMKLLEGIIKDIRLRATGKF